MHELAIASAVVDTAIRHARGREVVAVDVRVGALRQVVPDSLAFYFEIVSRDTACSGAELRFEPVAALLRCDGCGSEWDPAPPPLATHEPTDVPLDSLPLPRFRCTGCGAAGAEVLRGAELEVESIEISDRAHEEEPCTAPR